MIFRNTQTCSNCGTKAATAASFCPSCGTRLAGGGRICGHCNTENRGDAKFCRSCGHGLEHSETPLVGQHRWLRGETDFAVRIEADDLSHLLRRQLKIEPGTQALFVEGGAVQATIAPGSYTLDTLPQRVREWASGRVKEQVSILLVDTVPTDLQFNLGGIFTNDPLRIGFTIRMQTEVEQTAKFLINLLRGRERYSIDDLRQYLYPEVVQIAEYWVRQHSAQELAENFPLRAQFEVALEEALKTTFAQTGLRFLQIRAMEFNLEHLDRINGTISKARLMDEELAADMLLAEAELNTALETAEHAGKSELELDAIHKKYQIKTEESELQFKRDFEKLAREQDLIELAKETREVEMEERRVALYARMRQAVMSDKIDEVETTAEFEAFLDDVDREKLLREKDKADLLRVWKEEGEDHEFERAYLLAKLEVERQYELRVIELKLRTDLDEQALEAELRLERMRATQQQEIEFAKQEFELKRKRAEDEYADSRKREEAQLQQEQNEADIRQDEMRRKSQVALGGEEHDEEIRQLRAEMELGLDGLRGMKQVRLEEARGRWELEEQKLKFKWDQRYQEMEWELQKQERENELELQRERIKNDYELNRLDKLGQLGAEALISISSVEQGKVIADLKQSEAFKEMTEDQILALAAKDSPEVAKAFQEKFKAIAEGQASENERELYERLLSEQQTMITDRTILMQEQLEAQRKGQRAQAQTQQEMFNKGMDTAAQIAKDVAQAAQRDQQGPIIINTSGATGKQVYPPGQGGDSGESGEGKTKNCPDCARAVEVEAKFCQHCQYEFPG
jgi:hypothetical protein